MEGNGGQQIAEVLKRHGVTAIYSLSGAQIWPIYDGCVARDIRIVDVRHEATAGFAAEGHAKLTRSIGVAAGTAGPGVTNLVSAVASAAAAGSSLVALGGRAPQGRWGSGSLQELDHVPILDSLCKVARTVFDPAEVAAGTHDAVVAALTPHRGPVFVDVPLDTMFSTAEARVPEAGERPRGSDPDPESVGAAAAVLAEARRPVVVAGSDVWWEGAWEPLRRLVEHLRLPVVCNGLARGCIPAGHELAVSRARSVALKEADAVMVVGTPLDFRLGFGRFGDSRVIHVQDDPSVLGTHATPAASVAGDLPGALDAIASAVTPQPQWSDWAARLREHELSRREAEGADLLNDSSPIHPARVYGALREVLDPDAVVICDGGDFVSYAGKYVDSYTPGCWLDPGPFGCLGTGLGYAMAARVVHPGRQVVLLLGDGAFGFSGMDFDTLVRHDLPVVAVVGNNGIWGLEKHPMRGLYGWDVAADLRQETRYDDVVTALGGAGETVSEPSGIADALKRGFDSGVPYLVNVLIDPSVAYPRSSNLA
ncbi:MAG TPA: acetolactate synthase [Actinomycetota bacterium]|nr:acetolactate synthase [Actinomycetota bacterium]